MSKKIVLLTILISFFLNQPGFSAFDELGTSARAVGMGDNFVAVADDTYAIIYNPAGLGSMHRKEIATNTNLLYTGLTDMSSITESFAGGVFNTPKYGTLGLGFRWFKAGQLYEEDTTFISYGNSFFNVHGRPLYLGANIKMLSLQYAQTLYTQNAIDSLGNVYGVDPVFANGYSKSGMAYDLGALLPISDRFTLGAVIKNINQPDMGLLNTSIVSAISKIGISYKDNGLLVPFEVESSNSDLVLSAGFEKWLFYNQIAIRGGLQLGSRELSNITFGLSYSLNDIIRVDYGFSFPLQGIANTYGSHRFSIVFSFGATPEDKTNDWKKTPETKINKYKKGVKAFNKNMFITAYDLFKEESLLNADPKLRFEAMKYINFIVKKMKATENDRAMDKKYYYAHGLLMYIYNMNGEALKSWQEMLKLDKKNSEVKQYITNLKEAQDPF